MKQKSKSVVGGIGLAAGLMLVFYLLDNAPKDNGGNWIFFSLLTVITSYLVCAFSLILAIIYFLKRYFSSFLVTFGISYFLLDIVVMYLRDYTTVSSLLSSRYLDPDLIGILCLVIILYFREKPGINEPRS